MLKASGLVPSIVRNQPVEIREAVRILPTLETTKLQPPSCHSLAKSVSRSDVSSLPATSMSSNSMGRDGKMPRG